MNILIDCTNLKVGGGIQVATSFINDLNELDNQNDGAIESLNFVIVLSTQMKNNFNRESFSDKFKFIDLDEKTSKSKLSISKLLKKIEIEECIDRIFCVFGPSYYKSTAPKMVGYAIPHYVYKDSPYIKSLSLKNKLSLFLRRIIRVHLFKQNSSILVFETNDVRNRFCKYYNFDLNRTSVINNTLNNVFLSENEWIEGEYERDGNFRILLLTANYPHKNISIVPDVIDYLLKDNSLRNIKFVISQTKNDLNFSSKYDDYIDYLGFVPLNELPSLYKSVDLLFMPTLLECFSTTYLEAMFMRVPILASDMSFARDICGDGAFYFKASSAEAAAEAIKLLLMDADLRNDLKNKGFENFKRFNTSMERTKAYIDGLIKL
jgi:glycosyltransferase involved in cell wall biosynthesis